jgi:serine phosphatase RsbU (regulator of sigma subunit)
VSYINPDDNIHSEKIPAIPDLASQFIRLQGKQPIREQDILPLIDRFPVFFRQLLAIINSDHFNLTTKVHSIAQAIELAGFDRVCNLLLCLVVYKTFNGIKIHGVDRQAFWQDALRRAASARMIGELAGLDGSRCFTAGFLQDMGFYLLFLISPHKGPLWADFRKREPEARYSMERNIFNMNHDQAMEIFCQHWQLQGVMAKPVIHHHMCERAQLSAEDETLCKVLCCADWMTSVFTAMDKNFVINRCRQMVTECFNMEAARTEELLAALPDAVASSAEALGMEIGEQLAFSQILYQANIKLSEDNLNFQELAHRLEQALDERDRLAAELNRELGLAREIQQSLLPADMGECFPLTGINISARDLSGDFYDYFPLPDGRIYFNLGDVSGKGVNAALLMAKTSSLFRGLGKRIDKPGELLAQVNLELCETSIHGMFVTMIAGLYCPDSGRLSLVNAGNPPALLFSKDGLAREIDAMAPPLGVLDSAEFPEIELELGDNSLYMFSDGVTEGFIGKGEMLELSGLFKAIANMEKDLSPAQRINRIVDRFRHSSVPIRDDVTILLLEKQACYHAAT